jgi:hypothetical protein
MMTRERRACVDTSAMALERGGGAEPAAGAAGTRECGCGDGAAVLCCCSGTERLRGDDAEVSAAEARRRSAARVAAVHQKGVGSGGSGAAGNDSTVVRIGGG